MTGACGSTGGRLPALVASWLGWLEHRTPSTTLLTDTSYFSRLLLLLELELELPNSGSAAHSTKETWDRTLVQESPLCQQFGNVSPISLRLCRYRMGLTFLHVLKILESSSFRRLKTSTRSGTPALHRFPLLILLFDIVLTFHPILTVAFRKGPVLARCYSTSIVAV